MTSCLSGCSSYLMFLYFSFCYYCCFFFFVVFVFVFTETNLALFQSEDYTPFQERRSSANLVVKRGELGGTTTTSHRSDSKSLPQTIGVQCSPIERCDAWVKNRDNDLGSISGKGKEQLTAKARGIRELHTSCSYLYAVARWIHLREIRAALEQLRAQHVRQA